MDGEAALAIGSRVACDGYFGTVRYMGAVDANAAVNWVGVEWDDSTRGKHDGSYNGCRYFVCKQGCGSFVKPDKLNLGISFMKALCAKYAPCVLESDEGMFVHTVREHKVPIELVGRDKVYKRQKQLNLLRTVDLSRMYISLVDSSPNIVEHAPNINDLDLSHCLLSEWRQVFDLLHQLPCLNILCMSASQLAPPAHPFPVFPALRVLVLNHTNTTWASIQHLKSIFPNLQDLHLCGNNIKGFGTATADHDDPMCGFDELRVLNLESNNLTNWNEICRTSKFPKLERLILNKNHITQITTQKGGFATLIGLSLSHNDVREWSSIDALDQFPSLHELRFQSNPIVKDLPISMARIQIIARMGKISLLNGTPVNTHERVDAERYYLRQVEMSHTETLNPRYNILSQIHGTGVYTQPVQQAQQQYSNVVLRAVGGKTGETTRRITDNMRVQDLRLLCQRLFDVPPHKQRLFIQLPATRSVFPVPMEHDSFTLFSYGLTDGAIIVVEDTANQ